jgi:5'-nucleotidase
VQILAINDFHGHLEPPVGVSGMVLVAAGDPAASLPGSRPVGDAGSVAVPAGGAAYLATHLEELRAKNPSTIIVSAGDLTGASPLLSNVVKDEPAVLVMNQMGLDLEAVGNHDFDRGVTELRRLQTGGCPLGECDAGPDAGRFAGASFTYLAANAVDTSTHETVFQPYTFAEFGKAKIAFIGETLQATPSVTVPSAVKGIDFLDEAKAANALVPELKKAGASAIVLIIHLGGEQGAGGTYDSCVGFTGDIVPVLDALDPAIDVVISGHTHQSYDCVVGGRLVTSAASYGRVATKIELDIDTDAGRVVSKHAKNFVITRDVAPDPAVQLIIDDYKKKAAPLTERTVGYVKADFTGNAKAAGSASCETPLGDLIADAQARATGADVAFMNPGGIRADLVAKRPGRADDALSYGEVFEVQPFGNTLVSMTLSGAEIRSLLEAQFTVRADPRILQVSKDFSYVYAYDRAARTGTVTSIRIKGKAIDPAKQYRVSVNSFLAGGGDGFSVLKAGRDRKDHGVDLNALVAYLGKRSSAKAPLEPSRTPARITGDGCR